eukprot:COSAG02_NODE_3509_length_6634_cov_2.750574_3_plen_75_part_00
MLTGCGTYLKSFELVAYGDAVFGSSWLPLVMLYLVVHLVLQRLDYLIIQLDLDVNDHVGRQDAGFPSRRYYCWI